MRLLNISKHDFINYSQERKKSSFTLNGKNYNHLTVSILSNCFDYYSNRLVINNVGKVTDKNEVLSEYSVSIELSDDEKIEDLCHEVYCKAEWIARSI